VVTNTSNSFSHYISLLGWGVETGAGQDGEDLQYWVSEK
jgi:hypothetical protein